MHIDVHVFYPSPIFEGIFKTTNNVVQKVNVPD